MKIKRMKLDWAVGYSNDPVLQVLVDRIPDNLTLRFEEKDGLYFAEDDGYVEFYAWKGPHNESGFGGAHIHIIMKDGEPRTLLGPWSSRATAMNDAGFTPCMDVHITDEDEAFDRGHTFCRGGLTVEKVLANLDKFETTAPERYKLFSWKPVVTTEVHLGERYYGVRARRPDGTIFEKPEHRLVSAPPEQPLRELVWKFGEEAICPRCGNHNACLWHGDKKYRCRDCNSIYAVFGNVIDLGVDDLLGRKMVKQYAVDAREE